VVNAASPSRVDIVACILNVHHAHGVKNLLEEAAKPGMLHILLFAALREEGRGGRSLSLPHPQVLTSAKEYSFI
jgi:hypothetical protein